MSLTTSQKGLRAGHDNIEQQIKQLEKEIELEALEQERR